MVICTVEVNEKSPQTIVIGRRGTYNTQEIVFDIGYLIDAYGAGTAVLAIKRSQDSSAYPTVVTQEDTTLTWTVSETDTYYVGAGECQLMWYVDGGLAKTIIYPLVVMRDILSTSEEAPDAYQKWVDDLTALGAETLENARNAAQSASEAESAKDDAVAAKEAAEEAAETAQEAVVHAPIIQNGYWYIWNDGEYVDTGVRAEGQKGDKGDTGEKGDIGNGIASITKTGTAGLVDTYTVTYTDGTTTTFTVTNGAKGDKGDTGATGNGIASITKTGTSGNVDTYTITYTNDQTTTFTVTNGAVSSVAGKTGAVTLNANDVAFYDSGTYDDGTVGKELSAQKNAISELEADVEKAKSHGISDTAIFLLDEIGNNIAFTSAEGGSLWNSLIVELQNPTETERYYITYSGEHFISSNKMAYAVEGRGYSTTMSPKAGYIISGLTVTMGEESVAPIDNGDGTFTISIASADGAISIAVVATIDPSSLIYHVENLVCDGTQTPIETPLKFSSPTANGVTSDWSICARARQDAMSHYKKVFSTGDDESRLSFTSYIHPRARIRGLGTNDAVLNTMVNNDIAVVITHKAGNNKNVTAYYISSGETLPTTAQWASPNRVNNLDYNNPNGAALYIGGSPNLSDSFIGTIKDITIYNFEMSPEDAYNYIVGG